MRTTIQTVFTAATLLFIFSCSKENTTGMTNDANYNETVSASTSSNAFAQSMDEQADQTVVGQWVLYYDWYCDGDPDGTIMTVNSNGTWSDTEGYTGLWISGRRMFTFIFDNSETTYSGVMFVSQVKGIMSTFKYAQSLQGCFHMVPYKGAAKEELHSGPLDADGKKNK